MDDLFEALAGAHDFGVVLRGVVRVVPRLAHGNSIYIYMYYICFIIHIYMIYVLYIYYIIYYIYTLYIIYVLIYILYDIWYIRIYSIRIYNICYI